jgi:hypothetical protein
MFERYTEKARRTIFFSRYEASQYGSPKIEPEHLLLGLLREDKALYRWLPNTAPEVIRRKIDEHLEKGKCISTAVDLPLGDMAKKVLKHAANEADRLASRHIGPEHLFLGFLHEECFASKLLREGGADATQMRTHYAQQSEPPRPWSFQRGSYPDLGFRTLSQETVEIHGSPWNVDYVRDVVRMCRAYNWHWRHATWKPRAVAVHRNAGSVSFDLDLATTDAENFALVEDGWKKDHCFVCRWELFEAPNDAEHGAGYTNGHDWLCTECYTKFWEHPNFFSSSFSDIT